MPQNVKYCSREADEATLRRRIAILQAYRRMGLTSLADAEKYEADIVKRVSTHCHQTTSSSYYNRSRRKQTLAETSRLRTGVMLTPHIAEAHILPKQIVGHLVIGSQHPCLMVWELMAALLAEE